jgi:hypothetical protein
MYPRQQRHCVCHHIPANEIILAVESVPSRHEMDLALRYLRKNGADLIKGDLVIFDANAGYRNDGVTIFDGNQIVDLYAEIDDYGSLPPTFHVIEEDVPISYWKDIDETDIGRGIAHNNIVWFDHRLVREQCIRNIQYKVIEGGKYAIFTTFNFNGHNYRIIYDYVDDLYDFIDKNTYYLQTDPLRTDTVTMFQEKLMRNKLFPFDYESESYAEANDDFTLFVESCWDRVSRSNEVNDEE